MYCTLLFRRRKKTAEDYFNAMPALSDLKKEKSDIILSEAVNEPQPRIKRRSNFIEGINLSSTDIVETRAEAFKQIISQEVISEEELARMRDIRKRGKNKVNKCSHY